MAEIHVERKTSGGGATWLWWVIGLVVAALVIWAFISWVNRPAYVAAVPTTPAAVPGAPVAPNMVPVEQILDHPAAWTGKTVSGDMMVSQVVSDRAFWAENQGDKVLVVLNEVPGEIKEINAGQRIRLNGATVYGRTQLDRVSGSLAPQARQIAEGQPAILTVDSQNVDVLQAS